MSRPRGDALTDDLFAVPVPMAPVPASMDHRASVSHLVSQVIADAGIDRYELAARMSRLTGKEVSKAMLDGYTAESREAFNLPFYLAPAFETACETTVLTDWLARQRGGRLLVGQDVLSAELGRLERRRDEAQQRIKAIKEQLRRAS